MPWRGLCDPLDRDGAARAAWSTSTHRYPEAHVLLMGASVHYAGTFPMSREARPWTTDPNGRSRDFPNLWFADGSSFPFLPAKNLTFTLMANAVRVASAGFGAGR